MKKIRLFLFLLIAVGAIVISSCSLAKNNISLNGSNCYTIIYNDEYGKYEENACKILQEFLGEEFVLAEDEATEVGDYEILVGHTNRPESSKVSEGLGEHDYRIAIENGKLVLTGGSEAGIVNAIAALMRDETAINKSESGEITISRDYSKIFEGADTREEYISNPDLFLCNWTAEFNVPEWMLDFEEKWNAYRDPNGRMMAMHHRGDWWHYPENSIEGIISSVKMGADAIEVDLRLTKDNVVVLMHDETLLKTTDWSEKNGKNGLPESKYICDWTYEELCQLRLKDSYGVLVTDYKIPTFMEVLQVCNERTILYLDKAGVWDWNTHVYPLVKEIGAWRTCLASSYGVSGQGTVIYETIKVESGKEVMIIDCGFKTGRDIDWRERLDSYQDAGYQPIVFWMDYDGAGSVRAAEISIKRGAEKLEQIKGDARIVVNQHLLWGGKEDPEIWDFLYENGIGMVTVDNGLAFRQYIAEKVGGI